MRDEWAIADDYFRHRAITEAMLARKAGTPEGGSFRVKVETGTLVHTLVLDAFARKQGKRATDERIREALAFCQEMGSVTGEPELSGSVWHVQLPHPDLDGTPADLPLLAGEMVAP
jgi:hypothetical protein